MVKVLLLRLTKSQLDGVSLINALDKVKHLSGKYSAEQANIKVYDIVWAWARPASLLCRLVFWSICTKLCRSWIALTCRDTSSGLDGGGQVACQVFN